MAVVGRLTDQGELKVAGNVDTRLPMVTDGLVAHYPMDGTTKGIANLNILDYSTWVIGTTGTQTGFTANGSASENEIIEDVNPFGEPIAIWNALDNDVASGPDGGWNTTTFPIDNTQLYRYSIWTNRRVKKNGTTYFGLHGYGTSNGVYVHTGGAGATLNTNPYFYATGAVPEDVWALWVYYVWPHDNTDYANHVDHGIYYAGDTTKVINIGSDYRWDASTTTANERAYLYYSTDPLDHHQWCYPRVDLIDGTEPSLEDLIMGEGNFINPIAESNLSNTPYGVGVENSTTNVQSSHPALADVTVDEGYAGGWNMDLITNAVAQNAGWGNGYNGGVVDPQDVYHAHWVRDNDHNGICMLFRDEASPITGVFPPWMGIARTTSSSASALGITDNMDVTLSWLQKTSNLGKGAHVGLYHWRTIEGTRAFESNIASAFNTKIDEWERVSHTTNTGTNWDLAQTFSYYVYGHQNATGTLMVRDVQLELRDHATSFTETSRAANGVLELPFTLVPPYTIQFKHKSTWPFANQVDQSTSPYILQMGDYYGNASISLWNYIQSLKTYIKGDASAGWTDTATHFTYTAGTWDNVEHDYALVAVNNTTFKVYIDGVDSGVSTVSSEDVTNISVLKLGYGTIANAIYRDFSIYDRALTAEEIVKNAKGTHSVTANGLITKQIREEPALDKKAQYFPFGTDSRSNWNAIKTVTETDTSYANDGVFIGEGTTNVVSSSASVVPYAPYMTILDRTPGYIKLLFITGYLTLNNGIDYIGNVLSFSGRMYKNGKPHTLLGNGQLRTSTYQPNATTWDWDVDTGEFNIVQPFTSLTGGVWLFHTPPNAVADDIIEIFDWQVEVKAFPTPFVDGTRAVSRLHLPYYTIDCKRDFTIYGWWYPMEYANNNGYHPCLTRNVPNSNSTYNRILIMASDSSTSRRLRCWHSSDGITESSVITPAGTTEVKDQEWNFFCLKRDGADMKLFLGNTDGFVSATTATAFRLDADEATTQVWQVGQYITSESNAYHKDYVFLQSAMTDAAIEEVFKRKMKATTNGLIIQNKVGPNRTL